MSSVHKQTAGQYVAFDVTYVTSDVTISHRDVVTLAPNGTNMGLFKISFSTFWLVEPKCTETDPKNSEMCPHFGPI